MSSPRKCGECGVCCTALAVPSLNKPAGVACEHLRPRGTRRCAVHGTPEQPEECRTFRCAWQMKLLPASARPDSAGIAPSIQTETAFGTIVGLHEERPDAVAEPRAIRLLASALTLAERRGWTVVRFGPDGKRGTISRG